MRSDLKDGGSIQMSGIANITDRTGAMTIQFIRINEYAFHPLEAIVPQLEQVASVALSGTVAFERAVDGVETAQGSLQIENLTTDKGTAASFGSTFAVDRTASQALINDLSIDLPASEFAPTNRITITGVVGDRIDLLAVSDTLDATDSLALVRELLIVEKPQSNAAPEAVADEAGVQEMRVPGSYSVKIRQFTLDAAVATDVDIKAITTAVGARDMGKALRLLEEAETLGVPGARDAFIKASEAR